MRYSSYVADGFGGGLRFAKCPLYRGKARVAERSDYALRGFVV